MPFEWFVALRYLREGRAQTALILSAVSVGVSVVVFLSALINGLQTSLVQQTLGSQPHVTLRAPDLVARPLIPEGTTAAVTIERSPQRIRSIEQWASVLEQVAHIPGVTAASPTVTGAAFATRGTGEQPVLVRGVDAERFLAVIDVRRKLTSGRFSVAGSEVVVGLGLSRLLNVGVGDKLRLSTVGGREAIASITGVFDLGNKEVNDRWVITSLRQAQTLFDLPGGASTIELRVAEVFDADRVALDAADRTGLEANSWMKLNAQLLVGLRSQNSSKYMIQFFVVIAVALGIASVLIVSVVQKAREIGILRAVGTPRGLVLRVFLIQGAVVGLCGSFVGSALGTGFSLFFERLAANPDGSPTFPVQLDLALYVSASLLATGVGLLAAAIPARRAARLDPAEVIRHG
ncbi:MAG: ABC transporter permease [Myxococcales bacterium]|nr:ABC transporter permease [Myxococcales bacterium]